VRYETKKSLKSALGEGPSRRGDVGKWNFTLLSSLSFILPLFLVAAVFLALSWQVRLLISAGKWRDEIGEVFTQTQVISKLILDAETSERGYLITGNPAFLEPYQRSRRDLVLRKTIPRRNIGSMKSMP
jgi:CHASE3 domain sensor protein